MHLYKTQNKLLADVNCSNQERFWKNIGKVGIVSDRNKGIPVQVVLDNGDVSNDMKTVLKKWQTEFCNLLNVEHAM